MDRGDLELSPCSEGDSWGSQMDVSALPKLASTSVISLPAPGDQAFVLALPVKDTAYLSTANLANVQHRMRRILDFAI